MAKKKLTDKQQMFIVHYVSCNFHQTKAAQKAGYSKKTAYSIGNELLKKPEIIAGIKKEIRRILKDIDKLTLRWVNRVIEIAFSDPNSYITKNGDQITSYSDQLKALDMLGKYLTLYSEKRIIEEETTEKSLSREERRERILALVEKMKD
jgi:phage terminase small subunit